MKLHPALERRAVTLVMRPQGRMTRGELQAVGASDLGVAVDEAVAFYLISVDGFKAINEVLGHESGDTFLSATETRIQQWAGSQASVARISGHVFAAILARPADEVDTSAELLRASLARPVRVGGHLVTRSVSIGLACGRLSDTTVFDLFQRADHALDAAQATGGNTALWFTEDLRSQAITRSQIELHLSDALRTRALSLHFQPEVDLRTGAILAVEALMRWQHPVLGLLSAATFIGVAERSGVINDLGTWSLGEACRQRAVWQAEFPTLELVMRVNMSPIQLSKTDTPALVERVLRDTGLSADQLCIELTELLTWPSQAQIVQVIGRIRDLGVTVALDDFGAGYNSLLRLKTIPVDVLKIDRELVTGLGSPASNSTIVEKVIGLAAELGLEVVAEGVETLAERAELIRIGCWRGQGHLMGTAVSAQDLRPMLAAGRVGVGAGTLGRSRQPGPARSLPG